MELPNHLELINRIARRTSKDIELVTEIFDATFTEIYEAFKSEESVTIRNFGNFYIRHERESWVFRFNPAQKLRALFGWSSTYTGEL
jgi:DNA-binding protein HU-beta